jgi:hypothetical protein
MTGPVTSSSAAPFVQQFMQFPRQSIPRTLLYSAVANVAFYQLASLLARMVENKYPSADANKKEALGIVVFGGLTALFNVAQFKLFNFQLSRVVSLAIGVVITAVMTFAYFTLNRKNFEPRELDAHAQLISEMGVRQENLGMLLKALSISKEETLAFLYLIRDRLSRYQGSLELNQPGVKDTLLELIALRVREYIQPTNIREAQECLDGILRDLQNKSQERRG